MKVSSSFLSTCKTILLYLAIVYSLALLASCSKTNAKPSGTASLNSKYTLQVKFDVLTQENMNNYRIQVSTDGREYVDAAVILASEKLSDSYSVDISADKYFKNFNLVYARVVGTDNDGHTDITDIQYVRL